MLLAPRAQQSDLQQVATFQGSLRLWVLMACATTGALPVRRSSEILVRLDAQGASFSKMSVTLPLSHMSQAVLFLRPLLCS